MYLLCVYISNNRTSSRDLIHNDFDSLSVENVWLVEFVNELFRYVLHLYHGN